jgi:WD40 repeat protein
VAGHTSTVSGIVFSSDGSKVYTGSNDGSIAVWAITP